jgi:hypothetical protein
MARRDEYAEPIRIVEEMRRKNGKPAADTNGHANGGAAAKGTAPTHESPREGGGSCAAWHVSPIGGAYGTLISVC